MQVTGNNLNLHKSLSIRLCTDGFSFYLYSKDNSSFSSIPYAVNLSISLTANLRDAFTRIPALNESYERVQVFIESPSSFVPFDQFEEDGMEEIYSFNYPGKKGQALLYNILPGSNAVILFSLDKNAYQLLQEHFPQAYFYAAETPVIEHFSTEPQWADTQRLYAYRTGSTVYIYQFQQKKLAFANHFSMQDSNDMLYYLMQVWKSCGLNQLSDELRLAGDWPDKVRTKAELQRFIRKVNLTSLTTEQLFQSFV